MLLEKEKQNASLNMSQLTLSHEFRSPLSSTLMLLESLLAGVKDENHRQMIRMVIAQINLLICLVNDILDLKMLDQNKFEAKITEFSPNETFKFVLNIFA